MSSSFSWLRTVMAMGFACITSPSKVTRLGFSVLMRMGLLVSTWPPAGRAATASVAATSRAAPVPAHSILLECGDFEIARSEEHTSELQSLAYLVCRLLLEKKKKKDRRNLAALGSSTH